MVSNVIGNRDVIHNDENGFVCTKVKDFVKAIEDFESHFDLIYGQYVVDAKSLLGVMTMDIRNKVDLRIMERENEMPTIMKAISPYIAA